MRDSTSVGGVASSPGHQPSVRGRALAVDLVEQGGSQRGIHPGLRLLGEARVDGEAFVQLLAGRCGLPR